MCVYVCEHECVYVCEHECVCECVCEGQWISCYFTITKFWWRDLNLNLYHLSVPKERSQVQKNSWALSAKRGEEKTESGSVVRVMLNLDVTCRRRLLSVLEHPVS